MGELGARMGSAEFSQWLAFLEREPLGLHGDLQRWAGLMSAAANGPLTHKEKRNWRLADFHTDPWAEPAKPAPRNPKPGELSAWVSTMKPARARGKKP